MRIAPSISSSWECPGFCPESTESRLGRLGTLAGSTIITLVGNATVPLPGATTTIMPMFGIATVCMDIELDNLVRQ